MNELEEELDPDLVYLKAACQHLPFWVRWHIVLKVWYWFWRGKVLRWMKIKA